MDVASVPAPLRTPRRPVSPLRLRLLAFLAIAFFPIALLVVRLANDERRATTLRERDASLRLLDVALAEHRDLTRGAQELLRHLPRMQDISSGDAPTCAHSLNQLLTTYGNYIGVFRITPDLRVDCSAVVASDLVSEIDDAPLALAARTQQPVTSWIRYGQPGRPIATIVEPIKDGDG